MFNVSFGEILVVLIIFIITIEPSKFKEYLVLLRMFYFKFHAFKKEILEQIGFLEKPEKYILGDDGKHYESYKIDHIFTTNDHSNVNSEIENINTDDDNNKRDGVKIDNKQL